jgi:hypothetical protein
MSIPLVQKAEKDDINTSIIAIKRNIERINMLLGLVDSGSPDLSGLATKQELEDAITQVETDLAPVDEVTVDNMHSVTSNAVAVAIDNRTRYDDTETLVGSKNGYDLYRRTFTYTDINSTINISTLLDSNFPIGKSKILNIECCMIANSVTVSGAYAFVTSDKKLYCLQAISDNTYVVNIIIYYLH